MLKEWTRIMFDDIGNKIKSVAVVTTWVGIFLSIIEGIITFFCGIIYFDDAGYLLIAGPVSAVIGCIAAWLGSLVLYGFGQLIVNTDKPQKEASVEESVRNLNIQAAFVTRKPPVAAPSSASHNWRCSTCGKMISQDPCPFCTNAENQALEIIQDDTNWICPRCGKKNPNERPNCWSCGFKK